MKIHERVKRGKKVWTVDGKINGKRQRSNFETKRAAEAYLKTINKEPELSAWWAGLSLADRFDLKAAFDVAQEDGFTLLAAAQNQAVSGRGQTHLKKMTLAEAIGSSGVDGRLKDQSKIPPPSGYLGSKKLVGMAASSLSTLKVSLFNFRDYCGGDKQCKSLTPELVMQWLMDGGIDKKTWHKNTLRNYSNAVECLYEWLINKQVVAEGKNPVKKLEKFVADPFDPYVLTTDECRKILKLCHDRHFDVLPLLTLNLFCGIRPSETRRLETNKDMRKNNLDFDDKEVRFQATKTKTKMPRIVQMSDNCIAWLNCHEKLQLPIVDAKHKWEAFLVDAKKELGYDLWPHDCIRHSFCSYSLRNYEDIGKVAAQAGHSEKISLKHYLSMVSKAEAEAFWNIFPEETLKAAA